MTTNGLRERGAAAAYIIGTLALALACGTGAPGKREDDAMAEMPGMAGTPGTDSAKSKSPLSEVTFSRAQVEHGAVRWMPVLASVIPNIIELPGQIVANDDQTVRLASPSEGRVLAVHVSPGEHVARGDRLVSVQSQQAAVAQADAAKAQAELASRQAAATYARSARARAERLLALTAIPRQDYERAVADDALATAALAQAEAELTRANAARDQLGADAPNGIPNGMIVLRSPITGVVIARDAVPGAVVAAGAPLIAVTDPSSLWLTAAATGQSAPAVRVGARLRFSVISYPADTFSARIQSVSGAFDPVTRSLPLRAVVSNGDGKLRPEMFANVWIDAGSAIAVIAVPDSAIQRLDGKTVVFIAYPNDKGGARLEKREVDIGWASRGHTAIVRGLRAGDVVVVGGAYAVKAEFVRGKMPKMEM